MQYIKAMSPWFKEFQSLNYQCSNVEDKMRKSNICNSIKQIYFRFG